MPAMSQTPTGPVGPVVPSAPPPQAASGSAQAPPPPTSGPPPPQPTTPVRKRNSEGARPPPQVLCAPLDAPQGPSQDLLPTPMQTAATPPCEALCSSLLDVTPTAWLHLPARCQSELPRRSLTLIAAALCWLHSIVEDPRHGISQRSAAELIIALAPRCLWPEPPREKGQQLPANARPQLIQHRVQ
eukprot:6478013-Amphidinium_carterae.2